MPEERPFRLLVFDWDGTLMDSIATIVACTRRSFRDVGEPEPGEAAIRGCIGLGLDETFARLQPEGDEALRRRTRERYRHHWHRSYGRRSIPFPGVPATLAELGGRGFLLAVATGKSRAGLDRELEATGLGEHFAATRTASDGPSKPSPAILLDLMAELGAGPGETLVVGDTIHDLQMAANAGAGAVGVLTGCHRAPELVGCGALACLGSVAELPGWLEDGHALA